MTTSLPGLEVSIFFVCPSDFNYKVIKNIIPVAILNVSQQPTQKGSLYYMITKLLQGLVRVKRESVAPKISGVRTAAQSNSFHISLRILLFSLTTRSPLTRPEYSEIRDLCLREQPSITSRSRPEIVLSFNHSPNLDRTFLKHRCRSLWQSKDVLATLIDV